MQEYTTMRATGFMKIFDPLTGEIIREGSNHINYENLSEALAQNLANKGTGFISELHLGNNGSSIDATGVITYQPTQTDSQTANMYTDTLVEFGSNGTFMKIVDDNNVLNTDPTNNKVEVRHTPGSTYTDIVISCLLDYGEPAGQAAFDNAADLNSQYIFDEMGIKGYSADGDRQGKLLTHVIFHPFQKSANRLIQIEYTIRIQSLTNLTG